VIRLVEQDGWYFVGQRGSHRQYRHPSKPGKITVVGKPSAELAPVRSGVPSVRLTSPEEWDR
jgi:predicted RNA binding protein YcfA (HicA-like mRNA interferase family)